MVIEQSKKRTRTQRAFAKLAEMRAGNKALKVFATAVAAWTLAETCSEAKQKCSDLVDSYNDFVCSQTPKLEAKIFIDEIHQFAGMDPNNLFSYLFGFGLTPAWLIENARCEQLPNPFKD
jgi:hypothetical protein